MSFSRQKRFAFVCSSQRNLPRGNNISSSITRPILSTLCSNAGEADEGEYATLKTTQLQISEYDEVINLQRMQNDTGYDETSEEGKLLACVQDESVTYASTRDLEPPRATSSIYGYVEHRIMSPMAPVTVQVHSEHHVSLCKKLIN